MDQIDREDERRWELVKSLLCAYIQAYPNATPKARVADALDDADAVIAAFDVEAKP